MSTEDWTKVVVRHLPPGLDEDAFKTTIAEFMPLTNWFSYWPGKARYASSTFSSGDHWLFARWRDRCI